MYLISLTLFTISITTPVACRGFFRCYEACSNLTGLHTSGSLHEPEPSYWRRDYRHHHDLVSHSRMLGVQDTQNISKVEGTGGIGEGSGAV
ncbi:hypothetical protein C8R42DRAFT_473327 [Lentinula raphanica]|nr:hypothetical protein C8R42DRAFT_473327 [Lentinula raphanica]